jgi:putative oxidoreductase
MLKSIFEKYKDYLYLVFRVLVGLLFFQHGAQKLLGWFGSKGTVQLFSLMGLAGVLELVGGTLIALGILTRLTSLITSIEMLSAYFMMHSSKSLIPIMNGGELALLYFASFLILIIYGSGRFGIEKLIFKKELL